MNKPLIVFAHPLGQKIIEKRLGRRFQYQIIKNEGELKALLPQASALVTFLSFKVDSALLSGAPHLKVVGNYAVGVDNIDLQECARRKIAVVNTPNVLTRATAELALSLLTAVARHTVASDAFCREGKFTGWKSDLFLGQELKGRHAVIVGQGRIGKEFGKILKALGLSVEFISRKESKATISRKIKRAHVLSLHLSYDPSNHHWLNSERIDSLRKDCIVINTSRGSAIDEGALVQALKTGKIFGAGLDVYEKEPQIHPELPQLSNVTLLPHLGSATEETRQAMAELVMDGVVAVLSGKQPWNQVKVKVR